MKKLKARIFMKAVFYCPISVKTNLNYYLDIFREITFRNYNWNESSSIVFTALSATMYNAKY